MAASEKGVSVRSYIFPVAIERDEDGKGVWLVNQTGEREFAPADWRFLD